VSALPEETVRFLSQFRGRHTLLTFDDNNARKSSSLTRVLHHVDPDQLAELNAQGAGVYMMVNEGDGQGCKERNVIRIRAYFADFDSAPLPSSWPLEPSLIVETSPGRFHTHWILEDAETVPLDKTAWNRQQEAIARAVGAEPSDAKNLCRSSRLAGFRNRKKDGRL